MAELTAIIGTNNEVSKKTFKILFEDRGYSVIFADTFLEMEQKLKIEQYKVYVIQLDLDTDKSEITNAKKIYDMVYERVEARDAAFIGFSYTPELVAFANSNKILSYDILNLAPWNDPPNPLDKILSNIVVK